MSIEKDEVYKGVEFSIHEGGDLILLGMKLSPLLSKNSETEIYLAFESYDKMIDFYARQILSVLRVKHR